MNQPIKTTIDEIVDFLNRQEIEHCIIGGLAVSARARPRITDDVDLIIDCEPEAAIKLLGPLGRANFLPFFDGVERVIRESCILPVKHQNSGVTVDMSLAIGGLDQTILQRAEPFKVFGLKVPVATNEDLVLWNLWRVVQWTSLMFKPSLRRTKISLTGTISSLWPLKSKRHLQSTWSMPSTV